MKIKSQEEIALAQEKANEMIRVMYDKIENLSEYTVPLYDVIEGYFFQDIDYQRLQLNIPMWMADDGRSAESPCNKVYYSRDQLQRDMVSVISNIA